MNIQEHTSTVIILTVLKLNGHLFNRQSKVIINIFGFN